MQHSKILIMINKNKKNLLVAFSALLLTTASCNNYLDINDDPNNIALQNVTPDYILPGAITNSYYIQARRLNFLSGVMMNSYAGNSYSFGTPLLDEYSPNVTSTFYGDVWDQIFRPAANFQTMINFNDSSGKYTQYKAIARIMKAYYVQILTDLYGDIPYTEAFKGQENMTPKYDKGEDIYKASIADLEMAINEITSGKGDSPESADIVFHGDMNQWKAFANTLKLRHLIRMSNVTGDMATFRDQKLASLAGATFSTEDVLENPGYSSSSDAQQNPFANYFVYNSSGARPQNYTLIVPSEHISIALNGNNVNNSQAIYQKFNGIIDGRRGRMFTLVNGNVEGVRQGATPGQPGAESGRTVSRLGQGITIGSDIATSNAEVLSKSSSKSGVLMSKAEIEFLLAEAALRYPANFSGATTHFTAGINASFSYFGATGSTTYTAAIQAIPGLGISNGTFNQKLEAIMTQKWIALTGVNPEQSFFDYTRTGYPITPLPTVAIKTVKPNRLVYPNSEYVANSANVPKMSNDDVFAKNQYTPFWARN